MKGDITGLKTAVNARKFDAVEAGDEQLTFAKNFGMVFSYWNLPEIWTSFCDSYNGMLDVLTDFDQNWNALHPQDRSDLATAWSSFVLIELGNIVVSARAQAMSMYNRKKDAGGVWGWWWTTKWWLVYKAPGVNQYGYIKLDRTCRNLQ